MVIPAQFPLWDERRKRAGGEPAVCTAVQRHGIDNNIMNEAAVPKQQS